MLSSPQIPSRGLSVFGIMTVTAMVIALWSSSMANVQSAPANHEFQSSFIGTVDDPYTTVQVRSGSIGRSIATSTFQNNNNYNKRSAIDSYGNPIESLKPIDTPDGRKVVSAQGLQFEIPNYASGITEIRKPADDLLPPFVDAIAVAVPSGDEESSPTTPATVGAENLHAVGDLPNEHHGQQHQEESAHAPNVIHAELPAYLLELNDPDIGGPVDYMPVDDGSALKVIAWDLLPPHVEIEPEIITQDVPQRVIGHGHRDPVTNNIRVTLTTGGQSLSPENVATRPGATGGQVSVVPLHREPQQHTQQSQQPLAVDNRVSIGGQHSPPEASTQKVYHRGSVHFTNPTRTTPSTTTTTTTTTRRTTPSTTTTTTTTTRRPTTTTTTTTTTRRPPTTLPPAIPLTTVAPAEPLDESEFFKLEAGDSYTLPPWLADIDDPDLDVAVTFIVPTDNNEYNHTIERDILPPLEPFIDLRHVEVTAPTVESPTIALTTQTPTTTTSTTTTTTTRKPTITTTTRRPQPASSTRAYWVRANPTKTTTTTASSKPFSASSFNSNTNRFQSSSTNHFAQTATTTNTNTNTATHAQKTPTHHTGTFTHVVAGTTSTSTSTSTSTPKPFTPSTSHHHHHQHQHHTQQTLQPTHSPNASNQNLAHTNVDPIGSDETQTGEQQPQQRIAGNPFLSGSVVGGGNAFTKKPFLAITTPTPTTTTTTTTTPYPDVDPNPFDSATIPSWLAQFDYPDVEPGVPFIYDLSAPGNEAGATAVANDLLPPSASAAGADTQATDSAAKPVFVSSSTPPKSSFNASPAEPQSQSQSATQFSSLSPSTASSIAISSKVTPPLPSIQNANANGQPNDDSVTQPELILVPPPIEETTDNAASVIGQTAFKNPTTSFNNNFAAPFETTATATDGGQPPVPGAIDQESFPPFAATSGGFNTGVGTRVSVPAKTTFSKSDDGKVITNSGGLQKDFPLSNANTNTNTNQFLSTAAGFSTAKTASNSVQHTATSSTIGATTFSKSSTPSSFSSFSSVQQSSSVGSTGFTKTSTTATIGGGKYTGGFGGAPGVLGVSRPGFAVQPEGTVFNPRPAQAQAAPPGNQFLASSSTSVPQSVAPSGPNPSAGKYRNRFGGPPGVLVPYDNV